MVLHSPKNRGTRFSTKPSYFLGLYDDNSIKIVSGIIRALQYFIIIIRYILGSLQDILASTARLQGILSLKLN